jgi:hypothetical protein
MFSQLFVPDTVNYMIAGYVVITIGLGMYLSSLVVRWRKAAAEYQTYQGDQDQG